MTEGTIYKFPKLILSAVGLFEFYECAFYKLPLYSIDVTWSKDSEHSV